MNHIRTIVKHPATQKIIIMSTQFGFTFGSIFGALKGMDRGCHNNRTAPYTRPKYINPSVYYFGNLVVTPLIYGTVGAVSCSMIGMTAPISLPILYLCKDKVKKILVSI